MPKISHYLLPLLVSLCLIAVAGWFIVARHHTQSGSAAWTQLLQGSNKTLSDVLHKSPVVVSAHLTDPNQPLPTNKWFSDLAFDQKYPVFAYPLSYQLTTRGFSLSYAEPVVNADTVSTPHLNDISVSLDTSETAALATYDDLSVTVAHRTGTATIATSRITEGSPFVFVSLMHGHSATIATTGTLEQGQQRTIYMKIGQKTYGITTVDTAPIITGQNVRVTGNFAIYILPAGASKADYTAAAISPLTGTAVTYRQVGSQYQTTYTLTTSNGQPTIWGSLPEQSISTATPAGTLASLAGVETFQKGNDFTGSQAYQAPASALPLGHLTTDERATLISQLKQDIASTTFTASDSYGGGKELYRAANLLQLAEQLHQSDLAHTIEAELAAQLDLWLNPTGYRAQADKYFYYDTAFRGMVGVDASYGSDQFNDHHFHYGYIIYAAAILSTYDHSFMQSHQSMINLLVRDIASPVADGTFPKLRVFDSYFGHSWAAGLSEFGDGNNQESSSEAVLAWTAIYQWAGVSKDASLQRLAGWLYARETNSAQQQWLSPNTASFQGYDHPFASLIWGGKFDYGTWFSSDPAAILAIQLIPLSPAHTYTIQNTKSITTNLATVGSEPTLFRDYLAMYEAGSDPHAAITALQALQSPDFDSANSKTYALAWTYAQASEKR